MVEVVGDIVMPSEFVTPVKVAAELPSAPQLGTLFYDSTNGKLVVWTGAAYETVTSV